MKEIDLTLVTIEYEADSIGQLKPTEKYDTYPAIETSVSRNEWLSAGQQGMKADKTIYTSAFNYSGQEIAIIDDVRYAIYRTYINDEYDEIELYLRREIGYEQ